MAFATAQDDKLMEALRRCESLKCTMFVVPRLDEFWDGSNSCDEVGGFPCSVAERQMLRPSFVPLTPDPLTPRPHPCRPRRDADRGEEPGAEAPRRHIKLSVVASDIFGPCGREMMATLIAGERDPKVLAQLPGGGHEVPSHREELLSLRGTGQPAAV